MLGVDDDLDRAPTRAFERMSNRPTMGVASPRRLLRRPAAVAASMSAATSITSAVTTGSASISM